MINASSVLRLDVSSGITVHPLEANLLSELLDPAEVAARSLRVIPERFRKELETAAGERPSSGEREGLPPNYRMRADAHYVDQLIARTPDMAIRFVTPDDIDPGDAIDPGALESLTASIRTHGILQPLLVRREEGRYRIISGRRRLAAASLAGLKSVPCVVHQVDARKAEELARHENVRGVAVVEPVPVEAPAPRHAGLLAQLAAEVDGIVSSAALFGNQPLPSSKRITLDLVRSQAARVAWLLQAASLVDGQEAGERRLCLIGPLLDRVRDLLQPQTRLSGMSLELCVPDWNVAAMVNEGAMLTGITGAVVATLGLVDQYPGAAVTLMVVAGPDEPIGIEVAQDTAAVPSDLASRFFDAACTERPGGWPALLGALAARAAARLHGGDGTLTARQRRGSTLKLTLGRP
jgi:hypothetical protein